MTLSTRRLTLRALAGSDIDAVLAWAQDPEVCRYVAWGPWTRAQAEVFLDHVDAEWAASEQRLHTFAVIAGGTVVGSCAITVTSEEHRRGELGYVLARPYWGLGYASEAAAAVLQHAHVDLGLDRVEATCRPANTASTSVLRTIGMVEEGRLRSHLLVRRERADSLLFAAVRSSATRRAPDVR